MIKLKSNRLNSKPTKNEKIYNNNNNNGYYLGYWSLIRVERERERMWGMSFRDPMYYLLKGLM